MSKLLTAWFRAIQRSCLVGLLGAAVVLPLGCAGIFIPLWLVTELDLSVWVLIIPASLYVLILNGGVVGILVWILRRRKRRLDAIFTPLGLQGERYMLTGRQYHGTVEGREVRVRFYRGPMLEVHLGTSIQTRFGVAEEGSTSLPLARLFGRQSLELEGPGLSGLHIFALDEGWTRALLDVPEGRELVRSLVCAGESWALVRQVVLSPGVFQLRLYHNKNLFRYDVTPGEAERWLHDLRALARIAESLPAPKVTAQESTTERLARTGGLNRIGLIAVALLVGLPTCVLGLAAAAFYVWAIQ